MATVLGKHAPALTYPKIERDGGHGASLATMHTTGLTLDDINARLARAPYNRWLGLRVESRSETGARLLLPWRADIGGAPGMIHGGVLAALVDAGCYAALLTQHEHAGPTVDMRVDFHGNNAGIDLVVEALMVKAGRGLSTADARVLDANGRLLASGRCVYRVNRGPRTEPAAD